MQIVQQKEQEYSKSIDMQKNIKSSIREFLKDKIHVRNLIVSIVLWMATILGY